MAGVLRTVIDPTTKRLDLRRGQWFPRRRHRIEVIGDPLDEQASFGIAGNDGGITSRLGRRDGTISEIEPKSSLPGGFIGAMTDETSGDQDRSHVAIEVDRITRGWNTGVDGIVWNRRIVGLSESGSPHRCGPQQDQGRGPSANPSRLNTTDFHVITVVVRRQWAKLNRAGGPRKQLAE